VFLAELLQLYPFRLDFSGRLDVTVVVLCEVLVSSTGSFLGSSCGFALSSFAGLLGFLFGLGLGFLSS
jgi:hypothetical protein